MFGGELEDVAPTAASLEMFHNAFLVHDDIEDDSYLRRGRPTLHRKFGVPIAVNVGDDAAGDRVAAARRKFFVTGVRRRPAGSGRDRRMARETAEGQAMELSWIRWGGCTLTDSEYLRLALKKTCWYSFLAPVLTGAAIAGAPAAAVRALQRFAGWLGIAFQIHDDILNLEGTVTDYGKEIGGDLIEGKYTLILMHALRSATPAERAAGLRVLRRSRSLRSRQDVELLQELINRYHSLTYARYMAEKTAGRAREALARVLERVRPTRHTRFLSAVNDYCVTRGGVDRSADGSTGRKEEGHHRRWRRRRSLRGPRTGESGLRGSRLRTASHVRRQGARPREGDRRASIPTALRR